MNNLAFIASVVGSLAIPVTVLVALLIFRSPLAQLLGRIVSYEGLGQKVSFGQKLADAEKSVSEAVAQAQEAVERVQPGGTSAEQAAEDHASRKIISTGQSPQDIDIERHGFLGLAALATSNPSFVVIKAWEDLNTALKETVKTVYPDARPVDTLRQLPDLVREGYVNQSFLNAVLELRDLRSNVAHGQHNPTAGEAVAYLESAQQLMATAAQVGGYIGAQREMRKERERQLKEYERELEEITEKLRAGTIEERTGKLRAEELQKVIRWLRERDQPQRRQE